MNKISNYDELLAERKVLEDIISEQRIIMKENMVNLKEELAPFLFLLPVLKMFKKKDPNDSFLKSLFFRTIDLLAHQRTSSKIGWLAKLISPFVQTKT